MKNSKILRIISYIILPIIIAVFLVSILYTCEAKSNYTSVEKYFNSENFAYRYMSEIRDKMDILIFANKGWETIQDGENTIYQYNSTYLYNDINFSYFLIIYGNKALTNVKLTDKTNSIENIKSYILETNKKYVSYENDDFSSNAEIFRDNILDNYFKGMSITYYTKDDVISRYKETNEYYDEETEIDLIAETEGDTQTLEISEVPSIPEEELIQYHNAHLEDFSFYTSYNPELNENSEIKLIINVMEFLKSYEDIMYIAMPISALLILIIVVFLINSIGHEKGKEEIQLSDFDKIPLEIIAIVSCCVFGFSIAMIEEIPFVSFSFETMAAMAVTIYLVNIIVLEILCITFIARIKAKKFLETCICGKVAIWSIKVSIKVLRKILSKTKDKINYFIKKLEKVRKNFNENVNFTWKFIGFVFSYLVIAFILLMMFKVVGLAIDLGILGYILYEVILRINSFNRLEKGLQNIYEGHNEIKLNPNDFSSEFAKSVEYVNDISNGFEKAVETSLKSERLKTELITNVSHDIKTPLTSIINYVDLIKKENVDNEKIKEYVEILDNKSQKLKRLTEDLVEASKATSGNLKLHIEKIDLKELLNQAIGEYKDKFENKHLEIISNVAKEEIKIDLDSKYMYRVIDNLLVNVSKYALENSRVYIDLKKEEEKIKISIKNISKDRLNITEEELMQRFVRGDKSRTTDGSGLGLAIARSLTELQGGSLNCKIDGDLFKIEIEF